MSIRNAEGAEDTEKRKDWVIDRLPFLFLELLSFSAISAPSAFPTTLPTIAARRASAPRSRCGGACRQRPSERPSNGSIRRSPYRRAARADFYGLNLAACLP